MELLSSWLEEIGAMAGADVPEGDYRSDMD